MRLLTNLTLSLCLEGRQHDDDGIIFRCVFDQVFELFSFESDQRASEVEVGHLFDFVGDVILFGPMAAAVSGAQTQRRQSRGNGAKEEERQRSSGSRSHGDGGRLQ